MLVLSRRLGEHLLIGEAIRITVLAADHHQVRIGIDAPRSTSIVREELLQREEFVSDHD